MASPTDKIAIIGSGNLAWHLAGVLKDRAVVLTRQADGPNRWPVPILPRTELGLHHWHCVFLAVPDNAIAQVSQWMTGQLPREVPVFHTSGATAVDRLDPYFIHRGVLWPIRSLRFGETVTGWQDLPLVIHGYSNFAGELLLGIARTLSETVSDLDDRQRAQLHLAAVFSNNFVTALYEVAFQLCHSQGVPFELLLPIIRNTAGREDGTRPAERQTGAAARGDTHTMDRHLSLLDQKKYRRLYRDLSRLILENRLSQHDAHLGRDPHDDLEDEGIP